MDEQLKKDLQTIINAVRLAQTRGAYRLEQAEALAKNVNNVTKWMST